jgi:hypothetical protein
MKALVLYFTEAFEENCSWFLFSACYWPGLTLTSQGYGQLSELQKQKFRFIYFHLKQPVVSVLANNFPQKQKQKL